MSFYTDLNTGSGGERIALPPTEKGKPYKDLFVIKPVGEAKTLKNGATRHTLLVGSKSVDGTAFLKIDLHEYTLNPATIAIAFKAEESAISESATTAADINAIRGHLTDEAARLVREANTPEELYTEAVTKQVENLYTTVRINVGTIINLQRAAGQTPDPSKFTPESVTGATFTGSVKAGLGDASEISSVYTPKSVTTPKPELVTA